MGGLWRGGLAVVVAMVAMVVAVDAVTIMSVDIGSEWIKVAVVAPGVPMEIALNKESKRKTPAAISFRNGERNFGEDAMNNGVRFPATNYYYLLDLLGKRAEDSPVVDVYKKRFPFYQIEADEDRGTVVFRHNR
ncbi:Hypoxia up-regulated protein 1 [Chionoecetes opilio]|uniref:Hypoxia up-regulated protein 1 n=1 Tax=Chionoecetes opilio TaxID=41210 RepID=A0A8J4YAR2_CHIOP|nr:Hypoxia up-regulated protein 1 [Chionoecetes opilio]